MKNINKRTNSSTIDKPYVIEQKKKKILVRQTTIDRDIEAEEVETFLSKEKDVVDLTEN